jgi:DNA uptake protein ComE-like DNA-binding protein
MKSKTVVFLAATTACLLLAVAAFRLHRRPRRLKITTNDLGYQDHSPEELTSEHLVDLNTASLDDLLTIGLDRQECDQIVENRPYRNKLDLLSRMVIPEQVYNAIKQHVGIARATEPVKITG